MVEYVNKQAIVKQIIERLQHDLEVFFTAAKTAHEAATNKENLPDNKYDTLALEASYIAQGQANRAQELRKSIEIYKQLICTENDNEITMTSLVFIESDDALNKIVFIGPVEGGLKLMCGSIELTVITTNSPLGRELIGKNVGDIVEIGEFANRQEYEIVGIE